MSETTTGPVSDDTPTEQPATLPPPAAQPADDDREAAKYRRRLRDTEVQRDQLASRVETMQRSEAERLAAVHLADGSDLWLTGTTLADILDDDGNVSVEKITATAQQITATRPHWHRREPAAAPSSAVTANGKIDAAPTRTWSDVLGGSVSDEG